MIYLLSPHLQLTSLGVCKRNTELPELLGPSDKEEIDNLEENLGNIGKLILKLFLLVVGEKK
jgi:hypothetical protein